MADWRGRLHVLVEGQTEEIVVRQVLAPHLQEHGWSVTHSLVTTKRPVTGPPQRGGVTSWAKVERDVRLLLRDTGLTALTTLIDYYGFPEDGPGMATRPSGTAVDRVEHVERALADVIDDQRFLPHLVLHELETWVFAAAGQLGELRDDTALTERLRADVKEAGGPELVNDDPRTAPSKRLAAYCETYLKTLDGPMAIELLGLPALRADCPHFDDWLTRLEA
ncbi:DUF4276 family protein [Amycolatopsis suaedae]|uniref:DUF4276 family protein n=1 Tax=Amycolatopsis suaedae TaxID=2510978 RepID=A0A4Q7JCE1_9PSEU|nr:DUF4276 family protein [Amycolatopsis suaedae]RZQ64947.1 DUF4276 family protein [Amycolatopsis suaedae]